jgi:hypothetical protein
MVMSGDQNAGRGHNIKIQNSSLERVEQFKHLGTTITYKHYTQEEIKGRLKSGNFCYHAVQNLLSSILLFKNIKTNLLKTKRVWLYDSVRTAQ